MRDASLRAVSPILTIMGEVRPIAAGRVGRLTKVAEDGMCPLEVSCGETHPRRLPAPSPLIVSPVIDMELMTPAVSLRDLMRLQQRRGGSVRRSDSRDASRAEARRFEQERARHEEERRRLEYDRLRQR